MESQFLIYLIYLHAYFNLQCKLLYVCTICTLTGMFSIPANKMRILPESTICMHMGMISITNRSVFYAHRCDVNSCRYDLLSDTCGNVLYT